MFLTCDHRKGKTKLSKERKPASKGKAKLNAEALRKTLAGPSFLVAVADCCVVAGRRTRSMGGLNGAGEQSAAVDEPLGSGLAAEENEQDELDEGDGEGDKQEENDDE